MTDFTAPALLSNAHVQTILVSTLPRRLKVARMARHLEANSQWLELDGGDGIRLLGEFSASKKPEANKPLILMIHGWEGSSQSTYIRSAASTLWAQGHPVLRLNLRDHGPSHHLNRELFNSSRLAEVCNAVADASNKLGHTRIGVLGYSLGGNFALRIAAQARQAALAAVEIVQCVAVCPPPSPGEAMRAMTEIALYERHFARNWRQSLRQKLQHFPELDYGKALDEHRELMSLNRYFVETFTPFDSEADYFASYCLTGDALADLSVPSLIITSKDDPIIPIKDFELIADSPKLEIEKTRNGGHCGFFENYWLDSWIDRRLAALFKA